MGGRILNTEKHWSRQLAEVLQFPLCQDQPPLGAIGPISSTDDSRMLEETDRPNVGECSEEVDCASSREECTLHVVIA
jgi:hypothetical protein